MLTTTDQTGWAMVVSVSTCLLLLALGASANGASVIRGDPVAFSGFKHLRVGPQSNQVSKYPYDEEWLSDVSLDHFSFGNNQTFNLRYFINLKSYSPGGPILFYTGNEGNLEGFAENTGFMFDIAPELNAAVVFGEHRFYGKTKPFGKDSYASVKNLGYLSSEQALADFAVLLDYLKNTRIPGAKNSSVIAFGGSYGGMLAAWFRIKYPHIVTGAIAGSAPVFWFENANVDPKSFSRIVTRTFERSGCNVDTISAGFAAITELAKTDNGRTFLNRRFALDKNSTINKAEDASFLQATLSDTMVSFAMIDYPYPANFLAPLPGWPVKEVCRHLNRKPSQVPEKNAWVLRSVLDLYYNYTGKAQTYCVNPQTCPSPYSQLGDPMGWPWQACTEMVMPMCNAGLPNDFFPANCPFNVEAFAQDCTTNFGPLGYSRQLLRPDWVIQNYGNTFEAASNIVFSNGELDPWSGGGWSTINERRGSLVSVILKEGAHHYDLRGSHPQDTDEVQQVRKAHLSEIKKWLAAENRFHY
uniref:Lysosomal Pro-X carboxypeptidase n=1 Tax=Panagrellus redivivus TaxID=6233 RepID=A0A7E4WA13_PANRE